MTSHHLPSSRPCPSPTCPSSLLSPSSSPLITVHPSLVGEGRVHQCLRSKRKQLSEACRKEELLLEEKEVRGEGGRICCPRRRR